MTGQYDLSGVSIARGDTASADAFAQLAKTFRYGTQVLNGLVCLSAEFPRMRDPMLALATDGVGTKLKYAFASGRHKTVGIDLVAMCVNDLARNNITPLGFALYRATSQIDSAVMHDVVEGVVEGCLQAGCVYMTGETAEMPGFYSQGEYDLAGFAVGIFDRQKLITGQEIKAGDAIVALASSGLHSNGFSLVRKLFPPEQVNKQPELLEEILAPTKIYVKEVLTATGFFEVKGWAHITGGGIIGKLGKIIPDGYQAQLDASKWVCPEIFHLIQSEAGISWTEMYHIFNCGLGMIGVVNKSVAVDFVPFMARKGIQAYRIGRIRKRETEWSDKVIIQ